MSDEANIHVVRSLYEAFEDGDHDAIRACLADDLRWQQAASAVPAAGVDERGGEQLLHRVIEPIERDWDGFTEDVDHIFGSDDRVVAMGTYRGRHRASGRPLEAEFCHVWGVRDGLIRDFRQYTDTAAFAAASGAGVPGGS